MGGHYWLHIYGHMLEYYPLVIASSSSSSSRENWEKTRFGTQSAYVEVCPLWKDSKDLHFLLYHSNKTGFQDCFVSWWCLVLPILLQMTHFHSYLWLNNIPFKIFISYFISSFFDGQIDHFHILVIVNSVTVNMSVQVYNRDCILPGFCL